MALNKPAAGTPDTTASAPETPGGEEVAKAGVMVVSTTRLHDTELKVTLEPEIPTEVARITKWLKVQMDAGLVSRL